MSIPPLNQSYQMAATLEAYPEIRRIKEEYEDWCRMIVRWEPRTLDPSLGKEGKVHVGRSYDCAITLAQINFAGLTVAEFGARASHFSPWLTRSAQAVHASDLFGASFRSLGDLDYWGDLWKASSFNPERLHAEAQDMTALTYPDEHFDAVISFSAIEHIEHDTLAAKEMGRVCKPGGRVVIGTDLSDEFRRAGGYYYDEEALWDRIIRPTGCTPLGAVDLSWERADKSPHKSGRFDRASCIFVLRKPQRGSHQ